MTTAEFLDVTRLSSPPETTDMTAVELLDTAHLSRLLTRPRSSASTPPTVQAADMTTDELLDIAHLPRQLT
jgi:hypothetical protein